MQFCFVCGSEVLVDGQKSKDVVAVVGSVEVFPCIRQDIEKVQFAFPVGFSVVVDGSYWGEAAGFFDAPVLAAVFGALCDAVN